MATTTMFEHLRGIVRLLPAEDCEIIRNDIEELYPRLVPDKKPSLQYSHCCSEADAKPVLASSPWPSPSDNGDDVTSTIVHQAGQDIEHPSPSDSKSSGDHPDDLSMMDGEAYGLDGDLFDTHVTETEHERALAAISEVFGETNADLNEAAPSSPQTTARTPSGCLYVVDLASSSDEVSESDDEPGEAFDSTGIAPARTVTSSSPAPAGNAEFDDTDAGAPSLPPASTLVQALTIVQAPKSVQAPTSPAPAPPTHLRASPLVQRRSLDRAPPAPALQAPPPVVQIQPPVQAPSNALSSAVTGHRRGRPFGSFKAPLHMPTVRNRYYRVRSQQEWDGKARLPDSSLPTMLTDL